MFLLTAENTENTEREERFRVVMMTQDSWNTDLYEQQHAFVWQYGESLLELLAPQAGEGILDLGCGTGQLTAKIAESGAFVQGIDSSLAMISTAKSNYPHINFVAADARNFQVEEPLDAVFSNAVLHWIKQPDAAIACVEKALKPGGRFVAEFGGKGNVGAIARALLNVLSEIGCEEPQSLNPWYFPSIGEYALLLENHGFDVSYAVLFDRPTPLEGGSAGMVNWIEMFAGGFLSGLSPFVRSRAIKQVEERLRPALYRDGNWSADYRRIRVVAVKK
ncbi:MULTISPECIES: class I SAM-dependent methyltransferase [unclassified Microcoleus]|uniref:class I SAM-dependent methyltransferase n=1 Tax=unclassified Microcoleus TaxID=2642155 RepID=UPI0025DC0755|nr:MULTISPECIES: class I SAM-dependent methyltransferase [unclassified Microcoleus]